MVKVRLEDICDIVTFIGSNNSYILTILDKEDIEPQIVIIVRKDEVWTLKKEDKALATTGKEQTIGDHVLPSSDLRDWERCEGKINERFFLGYLKEIYTKII